MTSPYFTFGQSSGGVTFKAPDKAAFETAAAILKSPTPQTTKPEGKGRDAAAARASSGAGRIPIPATSGSETTGGFTFRAPDANAWGTNAAAVSESQTAKTVELRGAGEAAAAPSSTGAGRTPTPGMSSRTTGGFKVGRSTGCCEVSTPEATIFETDADTANPAEEGEATAAGSCSS